MTLLMALRLRMLGGMQANTQGEGRTMRTTTDLDALEQGCRDGYLDTRYAGRHQPSDTTPAYLAGYGDGMTMAHAVCQQGHQRPEDTTACRICGRDRR